MTANRCLSFETSSDIKTVIKEIINGKARIREYLINQIKLSKFIDVDQMNWLHNIKTHTNPVKLA